MDKNIDLADADVSVFGGVSTMRIGVLGRFSTGKTAFLSAMYVANAKVTGREGAVIIIDTPGIGEAGTMNEGLSGEISMKSTIARKSAMAIATGNEGIAPFDNPVLAAVRAIEAATIYGGTSIRSAMARAVARITGSEGVALAVHPSLIAGKLVEAVTMNRKLRGGNSEAIAMVTASAIVAASGGSYDGASSIAAAISAIAMAPLFMLVAIDRWGYTQQVLATSAGKLAFDNLINDLIREKMSTEVKQSHAHTDSMDFFRDSAFVTSKHKSKADNLTMRGDEMKRVLRKYPPTVSKILMFCICDLGAWIEKKLEHRWFQILSRASKAYYHVFIPSEYRDEALEDLEQSFLSRNKSAIQKEIVQYTKGALGFYFTRLRESLLNFECHLESVFHALMKREPMSSYWD